MRNSRRPKRRFLFARLLCLLSAAAPCAAAQEPPPLPPGRIAVRVELVNLEVTVADAQGNFVSDLKRENFRVLDEGVEQPLTSFAAIEAPAQVLVLVETSPAVYLIHQEHLRAAYALLEGLAADDRVALGSYDGTARLVLNLTPNKPAVALQLDRLHYNLGMGQLNLFDGLQAALGWLAPVPGKKAIVLLTTGLDTSGASRWETLLEKLRDTDVMVLPVALGGELREADTKKGRKKAAGAPTASEDPGLSFAQADRALRTIAEVTGGRAYFPRDARDFAGIYRQIAVLLRHQYSLAFRPPACDARYHHLDVQIRDASGRPLVAKDGKPLYRIAVRPGYLAPGPGAAPPP